MQKNIQKIATLVDGKKIADEILFDLKIRIATSKKDLGLAAILIGDDPASLLYIKNKEKACNKIGVFFSSYLCDNEFYPNISEDEIMHMIDFLNKDQNTNGIIVQLPIPKKFNTERIIQAIDPKKDVDGFHPENYKKFLSGNAHFEPPLISSIIKILKEYDVTTKNAGTIIVANSKIFSRGLDIALQKLGAKTEVVLSTEKKLKEKTMDADIVISIAGKPNLIKGSMVKQGVVVIDAGIKLTDKGFVGDCEQSSIRKKASLMTPTPGGVGPITVAMLLKNLFEMSEN